MYADVEGALSQAEAKRDAAVATAAAATEREAAAVASAVATERKRMNYDVEGAKRHKMRATLLDAYQVADGFLSFSSVLVD